MVGRLPSSRAELDSFRYMGVWIYRDGQVLSHLQVSRDEEDERSNAGGMVHRTGST